MILVDRKNLIWLPIMFMGEYVGRQQHNTHKKENRMFYHSMILKAVEKPLTSPIDWCVAPSITVKIELPFDCINFVMLDAAIYVSTECLSAP